MTSNLFSNLEFHRSGVGLLPDPHEPDPGLAVHLAQVAGSQRPLTFCSCAAGRRNTCSHLEELSKQLELVRVEIPGSWSDLFSASRWLQLAQALHEAGPLHHQEIEVRQEDSEGALRLIAKEGEELLRYVERSPGTIRLLERLGATPKGAAFSDRAGLLDRLGTFLRSPEEQHLNKAGMRTNRQSFEDSFWWRLAYHGFREFENRGTWKPIIAEQSGAFVLQFRSGQPSSEENGIGGSHQERSTSKAETDEATMQIMVPREKVREILDLVRTWGEGLEGSVPVPLLSSELFHAAPSTQMDPELRPKVDLLIAYGEEVLEEEADRDRFRYGRVLYLEELGALIEMDQDPDAWRRDDPESLAIEASTIGTVSIPDLPPEGDASLFLEDPMADLGIFTDYDYMELIPDDEGDDDLSMGIRYYFGEEQVTLGELLRAKKAGQPYYETATGWIDLNAPALRSLTSLLRRKTLSDSLGHKGPEADDFLSLSSAELLRLRASSAKPIRVEGGGDRAAFLERFLELKPSGPLVMPKGLKSELRSYQKVGLEWLRFLYENRLAGLLCDDMGLGKTHQAMALMVLIREQYGVEEPFLVVSPRTVISHWRNKLREHAPSLTAVQHHGPQRSLERALDEGDVVLTSYGVLRNDVAKMKDVPWGLIIFDEVQQIKNRHTQGYQAASAIPARMKVGLTGTPIENSLSELKTLFDLILPGYLGSEDDFRDRYGAGSEGEMDSWHLEGLRRLTGPFVLRRVKTAVLDELPEKIEDVRTCSLSPEQLSLYRNTIATKGVALMNKLRSEKEALPYIHIFALLNMLKQICDHPALALNQVDQWRDFECGKWDLFCELLGEGLDSGQKVVVFSQYLGMIDIMERHLEDLGVPFVTLTGSSRNRGALVDRFNNDPDCRVFLGSLKAGGTGIDLIGGSVVIHYDRWWNAAREDQATDRLYRIGQKRVVQVFKLVTEDTLEERIAMIIDRKRQLMTSVVQEDDPSLNKIFTREELIELLQDPE